MKVQSRHHLRPLLTRAAAIATWGLAFLGARLDAVQFEFGEFKGSFDSTLSIGGIYRLKNPDPEFYGTTSAFNGIPGRQNSVNTDDGNLNYGKGWASQLIKGNHDLEFRYRNFGALVRGY